MFLIAKTPELFVTSLAKDVHRKASGTKRKTLQKRDVLAFLEGAIDT